MKFKKIKNLEMRTFKKLRQIGSLLLVIRHFFRPRDHIPF